MAGLGGFSDFLAAVALLVAVVSAVYARTSAKAAQASNKIGLHQPRKEIYDGLLAFRALFMGMDIHPTEEEIDAFYIKSVAPSAIYLPPDVAQRIHKLHKRAWHLYTMIEVAESGDDPQMSKWDYINPLQELGRTEVEEVIRAVTDLIHVGRT
ncbi:hypothetical protein LJR168_000260 [Pseudoxanthomonas sp. LjRoot168]|uniref:hypothetical protein n=1 Tax=unclassified Pseudoxanthomonas TaxID=2645906 RepID=UPI003ED070C8